MANKDNRTIVVLDMGINGMSVLNLLKRELVEETFVYINDLDVDNYEEMEIDDIERRISILIERLKQYNPKLLVIANDTLIEYGKELFEELDIKKVYIVDEIIDYVNENYDLKNMAFFAPQGIIESNMYQKNFKYSRLYNLNADNMMESLNNALMKTSASFNDMKLALLPIYKKELDVIIPTLPNLLLFQTEIYEYVKSRDVDVVPVDKIIVSKTKRVLKTIEEIEFKDKVKAVKNKAINIVLRNSEHLKQNLFKTYVFKKDSPLKNKYDKILSEKYNLVVE